MIECPDCGAQNADNSTFCIRCGTQFAATAALGPLETLAEPDPSRLVDEAAELYAVGHLDDAAAACRAALDLDSELVPARALLGMIEEDRGNHAAALAEYEAVIRLAPERTAEREKADRMRALVRSEAGPAILEEEPLLLKYKPALIAAGVALLVLLVGGLVISAAGGRKAAQTTALDPGQPGGFLLQETAPQMGEPSTTGEAAASLNTGGGMIPTTPIGGAMRDQSSQQQPNAYQQSSSSTGGGRPRTATVDPIDLPPPTLDTKTPGTGPLTVPNALPPSIGEQVHQPSAIGPPVTPPSAPMPQESRGKVRIWVGDEAPPPAASNQGAQQPEQQHQQYSGTSLSQRQRAWSSDSRQGSSPALRSGGNTGWTNGAGAQPAPVPGASSRSGSSSGRMTAPTGQWNNATHGANPQPQPRAGQGSHSSPGALMPTHSGNGGAGQSQPRNYTGSRSSGATRQPAQTQSAPASTSQRGASVQRMAGAGSPQPEAGRSSSGSGGSSASNLRAQAQRAQASGNKQQAQSLYKAAMESYRSEAAANPGRAAASRSAIDSCQRSLDALDASR